MRDSAEGIDSAHASRSVQAHGASSDAELLTRFFAQPLRSALALHAMTRDDHWTHDRGLTVDELSPNTVVWSAADLAKVETIGPGASLMGVTEMLPPRSLNKAFMAKGKAIVRCALIAACVIAVAWPAYSANADDAIDPSLIPDGSYPAHVDRVINPRHLAVTMQGTLKVFLEAGRANINFADRVKANDDVIVTLAEGKVMAVVKK